MELISTYAFLLSQIKYEEASLILTFFTREEGKIVAFAKSALKSKKRFGTTLDYFNELNLTYQKKTNSNLYFLISSEIIKPNKNIKTNQNKFACACYFLEIILELSGANQKLENIYNLLYNFLHEINNDNNELKLLINYCVNLLRSLGYFPELSQCHKCLTKTSLKWYYSFKNGNLLCAKCKANNEYLFIITPIVLGVLHNKEARYINDYLHAIMFINKVVSFNIHNDLKSYNFLNDTYKRTSFLLINKY